MSIQSEVSEKLDILKTLNPAGIYLLKVSNGNTSTRGEKCSKLTIKAPERRQHVIVDRESEL